MKRLSQAEIAAELGKGKKRKEAGTRGKYAEDKVTDFLKATKHKNALFDYERLYDARSAGGRFPSQIADFAIYGIMDHGVIEVKQVAHDFRLPAKNFPRKKFPALLRRQHAGGTIIILIYHSTTKLWRVAPFEYFNLNPDLPSWDVSVYPTYKTVDEALGRAIDKLATGPC